MVDSRAGNFWAITCYFNPVGYRRRLDNYHTFRQRLKVPLVTVELSFDKTFQLASVDADILLQLSSPSILWQKERLLNVALKSLPAACDKVAWLDCDILFEDDGWVERARGALDEFELVHLFQERVELPIDFTAGLSDICTTSLNFHSVVHRLAIGETTGKEVCMPGGLLRGSTAGLAWASHRDTLEEHGLYDAFIVGGGDRAIFCAAAGMFSHLSQAREMNPRRTEHYLAWAKPYFTRVQGRVGHIPGRVFHLWHGDLNDRRHQQRHRLFARFEFDPYADIALDPNGCWRWNSDKPEMHAFVRDYFVSRKEDGT